MKWGEIKWSEIEYLKWSILSNYSFDTSQIHPFNRMLNGWMQILKPKFSVCGKFLCGTEAKMLTFGFRTFFFASQHRYFQLNCNNSTNILVHSISSVRKITIISVRHKMHWLLQSTSSHSTKKMFTRLQKCRLIFWTWCFECSRVFICLKFYGCNSALNIV